MKTIDMLIDAIENEDKIGITLTDRRGMEMEIIGLPISVEVNEGTVYLEGDSFSLCFPISDEEGYYIKLEKLDEFFQIGLDT